MKLQTVKVIGIVALTAAAAWLRIAHLDRNSITHPEMYVPGIHLPEGLSEPHERLTLPQVITGTFSADTHPPGYYVMMWAWTKVAGSSLTAIRLPSAILGSACIPLLFWLACLAGQERAGWIASACLAFSGYHVFWSRAARMFALECFLGLVATILLLLLARAERPRRLLTALYVLVLLAGLTGHIFFWSLVLTHAIWTFLNARDRGAFPGVLKAQLLTIIAGSPLLAFAAYQSGNTLAELSANAVLFARGFVQFAFILPGRLSAVFPAALSDSGIVGAVVLLFGLAALIAGIYLRRRRPPEELLTLESGPRPWTWLAAAAAATALIAGFIFAAYRFAKPYPTIAITEAMLALPLLLAAGALLLYRFRPAANYHASTPLWTGSDGLLTLLAILPFLILAAVSLGKPIFNQRGMLFAAPYLLLLLAMGIVAAARRPAALGACGAALAAILTVSLREWAPMKMDPADYAGFVRTLTPRLQPGDMVFLVRRYSYTPVLYYLNARQYHLVAHDYREACMAHPGARVWALALYDSDIAAGMKQALSSYRPVDRIETPWAMAVLFDPGAGVAAQQSALNVPVSLPGPSSRQ